MKDENNYVNPDGTYPLVKVDDTGIRPAGKPDECFYCHSKIGEQHKNNCVTVCKRVKLKATIEYEIDVPNHWDKEVINFRYNDSTWCASNIVGDLEEFNKEHGCMCDCVDIEYIDTIIK